MLATLRRLSLSFAFPLGLAFLAVWQGGGPADFWRRFLNEVQANDPKTLMQMVRKEPDNAIWSLYDAANSYQVNNNPDLGTAIEKLVKAWKEAYSTNFLDKHYDELRNFDQGQWNEWRRSTGRWNGLLAADGKRRKGELDDEGVAKFTADAVDLAGVFEALGDKYLAGACWYWAGASVDPEQNAKTADVAKCVEYYRKALKLREELDHKDSWYNDLAALATRLESEAKKGGAPKKPGDKKPGPTGAKGGADPLGGSDLFAKDSKWLPSPGKFAVVAPGEFERPGWNTDEYYLDWIAVGLEGKPGTKSVEAKLPFFETSKEAKFLREADSKYAFDPGDKTAIPIKLAKPTPFEFRLPGAQAEYAFSVVMGSNQEPYHGATINVSSSEAYAQIYYATAASRMIEVAGQKVRVFDDNVDGRMGSDAYSLKDFGGRMDGGLPLFDSMILGAGKRAVPFSGFVKLGPKWYRLKSDSEGYGVKFQARELDIKTGTMKLVWNGPAAFKPKWMIVREVGELSGAFFDLLSNDKGVEVPVGEYELFFGMYRTGKGKQVVKYAVIPGKDAKKIKVDAGASVTITMGAPFHYTFKSTQDASEVTVTGKSVEIQGAAGERYVLLSDETPRPKVEWRKPGAKAGSELGEMKRGELSQKLPPSVLCYPVDFKAKKPDASAIELRLVEEHKWFGPVASEWSK